MTETLLKKIEQNTEVVTKKYIYTREGVYVTCRDVKKQDVISTKTTNEYRLEIENKALKKEIKNLKNELEELKQIRAQSGRKKILDNNQIDQIKQELGLGVPLSVIARNYGVSRNTIYKAIK